MSCLCGVSSHTSESASSLCKLPGITECVKILKIGFCSPDNYYLLRHLSFSGYFWQLIFWKKIIRPFDHLEESENSSVSLYALSILNESVESGLLLTYCMSEIYGYFD